MTPSISKRTGTFTLILSAATVSLLLVGAGCSSQTSVDANVATVPSTTTNANANANVNVSVGDVSIDSTTDTATNAPVKVPPAKIEKAAKSEYKDGTYTAVGHYTSPGGPETINVTVTLKADVITDVNVVSNATNNKSIYMQNAFISGYKAQVVGRKIQDVNVGKVAGSSLTPIGFNEAIASIKAQAKG
ncbi:MAG: hypothetical protein RLZZ324_130 [Candidatus Parcubacteria bacterium]|jgi:uncharacterized protein with FMN-binding domain